MLEAAPAPLMRVLAPELADWFVELHRAEGVEVLLSAQVARLRRGPSDGAEWVQLTDGRRLECDALVIGIGIEPATEWLEGSGLDPDGVRDRRQRAHRGPGRLRRRRLPRGSQPGRPGTTSAASNGRPPPARVPRSRGRSSASSRRRRRCPRSGPTSTACASSWSATPREADEIEFDGDPAERDFSAAACRATTGRSPAWPPSPRALAGAAKADRGGTDTREESKDEVPAASG